MSNFLISSDLLSSFSFSLPCSVVSHQACVQVDTDNKTITISETCCALKCCFSNCIEPCDITDPSEFFSRSCSFCLTCRRFPVTQISLQPSERGVKSTALLWSSSKARAEHHKQGPSGRCPQAPPRLKGKFGSSLASGEGSLPPVGSEQHPQHCAPAGAGAGSRSLPSAARLGRDPRRLKKLPRPSEAKKAAETLWG